MDRRSPPHLRIRSIASNASEVAVGKRLAAPGRMGCRIEENARVASRIGRYFEAIGQLDPKSATPIVEGPRSLRLSR